MSSWMLGLAGVLYAITAIDFIVKGNNWMALAFANVGFIGATT